MSTPPEPPEFAEPDLAAQARAGLARVDELPVTEHAAAYADVQERLQAVLASLDHL